jgi:hypothetical protein
VKQQAQNRKERNKENAESSLPENIHFSGAEKRYMKFDHWLPEQRPK